MKKILAAALSLFASLYLNIIIAQSLADSTIKKIDSLFSKWNNNNSPGCTVGIIRNDSLIFSKGYGMANLEYGIPNTPETIYHMASVFLPNTLARLMMQFPHVVFASL